jgi:hypothetical protein
VACEFCESPERLKLKRERIHQIKRWLEDTFPVDPLEVRLRVESMPKIYRGAEGVCEWNKDETGVLIRVAKELPLSSGIYSLLHEWAHARTDVHHDDEFYLELGRIEREFWGGGSENSRGY